MLIYKWSKEHLYRARQAYRSVFLYPRETLDVGDIDYSEYWKDKRGKSLGTLSSWQLERACVIERSIGDKKNTVLTDIGCGCGEILEYLKDHVAPRRIVGVDSSTIALEHARKAGIETIQADMQDIESLKNIPESDYILLLEVLEHIPNAEALLTFAYTKSREGVFFSFPNSGYFLYRLRFLFGKFPMQWQVYPGEHVRFWTRRDLVWWLKALRIAQYQIFCYKGIPVLNKVMPSLFAAAFIVFLKTYTE